MKQTRVLQYGIILLVSAFALWGCPKNAQVTATPDTSKTEASGVTAQNGEGNSNAKMASKDESAERSASAAAGLQPIYFDFNKSFIREDAQRIMKANAEWLKAHPQAKVRIEGNCDERGTREYNQALGQRRAASAKKFLTDLGIPARRITLISYGKEKPVCTESSEACWQKDRRDDLAAVNE